MSNETQVKFSYGQNLSEKTAPIENGTLYIDTAKKQMFYDLNDTRERLTTTLSEKLVVNLGSGGSAGGLTTGVEFDAGTDIRDILKQMLQKAVPPTYTKPTITLSSLQTAKGDYEYGTSITAEIEATFTKNDAGALTSIEIFKDGSSIKTGTTSPLTSESKIFNLTATTKYTATAAYGDGIIKDNNLGNADATGQIKAGSITSSTLTFTPYRPGYFYGVLDTDNTVALTSDIIRSGTKKNGAYAAGNLPLIKVKDVANRKRIFVALPKTNIEDKLEDGQIISVVMPSAMNADCTADFVMQTTPIDVEGANNSATTPYIVWVYEPAEISDDQTFLVTIL